MTVLARVFRLRKPFDDNYAHRTVSEKPSDDNHAGSGIDLNHEWNMLYGRCHINFASVTPTFRPIGVAGHSNSNYMLLMAWVMSTLETSLRQF